VDTQDVTEFVAVFEQRSGGQPVWHDPALLPRVKWRQDLVRQCAIRAGGMRFDRQVEQGRFGDGLVEELPRPETVL
jgi:hypothetical protein